MLLDTAFLFLELKVFYSQRLSQQKFSTGEVMLDKETFHPLNYIKKEEYSGSMDGMRYLLKRVKSGEEDVIRVTVWPEPLNLLRTAEHLKESIDVPMSEEGVEQAADWINERYEAERDKWQESLHKPWV